MTSNGCIKYMFCARKKNWVDVIFLLLLFFLFCMIGRPIFRSFSCYEKKKNEKDYSIKNGHTHSLNACCVCIANIFKKMFTVHKCTQIRSYMQRPLPYTIILNWHQKSCHHYTKINWKDKNLVKIKKSMAKC